MKEKCKLIYNTINNFINKHNSNNMLFLVLFFVVLLIGIKFIVCDILAILLLIILILFMKPEDVLYSYIFLFFFELVTEISLIGGSINRVVLLLGLIKIVYCSYKKKVKIKKENVILSLFFTVFLIYSIFVDKKNIVDNVVLYVNFLFFLIYCNYLSSFKIDDKKIIINRLLHTIVCGAFLSIVYGFIFWNFDLEYRLGFVNWRFNGTNDPNFLAYYINLSSIIQIFRKKPKLKKDRIINWIINIVLLVGLVLTKSITGIFINIVSFIVFVSIKNKEKITNYIRPRKKKIILITSLCILVFGIGVYIFIKHNINQVYTDNNENVVAKNRIADILLSIKNGDVDRLTSQKTRDWRLFLEDFKNNNIVKKAFGKGMDTFLVYNDYLNKQVASHSTYIDFLCCYGIVGMIFIMWHIFRKTKNNIVLLYSIDNKVLKYVRIILLVYAIELNIYTNRVFLMMFLL